MQRKRGLMILATRAKTGFYPGRAALSLSVSRSHTHSLPATPAPPATTGVARAPLKPQQRNYILRVNVVPSLLHQLVCAQTTLGELRNIDVVLRKALRKFLHLPKDTPLGFFHAPLSAGGLGFPCLEVDIPAMKFNRMARLGKTTDPAVSAIAGGSYFQGQMAKWDTFLKKRLGVNDSSSKKSRQRFWTAALWDSCDGKGLRSASTSVVPGWPPRYVGSKWVTETVSTLRGAEFCTMVGLRAGTLMTRVRVATRFQREGFNPDCGSCFQMNPRYTGLPGQTRFQGVKDTLGHRLQTCVATHGMTVRRHDSLVVALEKICLRKGYETKRERVIATSYGNRVPDLIIRVPSKTPTLSGPEVWIVDPSIVADNCQDLNVEHWAKVNKYSTLPEIAEFAKQSFDPIGPFELNVRFSALIFSWRGFVSTSSLTDMLALGLSKNDVEFLARRVVQCGAQIYRASQKVTHRLSQTRVRGFAGR